MYADVKLGLDLKQNEETRMMCFVDAEKSQRDSNPYKMLATMEKYKLKALSHHTQGPLRLQSIQHCHDDKNAPMCSGASSLEEFYSTIVAL